MGNQWKNMDYKTARYCSLAGLRELSSPDQVLIMALPLILVFLETVLAANLIRRVIPHVTFLFPSPAVWEKQQKSTISQSLFPCWHICSRPQAARSPPDAMLA